jgi:hypothetical protein
VRGHRRFDGGSNAANTVRPSIHDQHVALRTDAHLKGHERNNRDAGNINFAKTVHSSHRSGHHTETQVGIVHVK